MTWNLLINLYLRPFFTTDLDRSCVIQIDFWLIHLVPLTLKFAETEQFLAHYEHLFAPANHSWIEPQNPQKTHIHKQCNTVPLCTNFQLHTNRIEKSRNGCATSEDLFWKLDALQSFIRDLHWPDAEFRQHLEQRLKLMACDMIESCLQRTEQSFQQWLKKSVTFISTDYIISTEMCAMVNVILDAKNQSFKLCSVDGIDVVSYCFESAESLIIIDRICRL